LPPIRDASSDCLRSYKARPQWFYGQAGGSSSLAYVILAFPYTFFSLDRAFRSNRRAHDEEASQSLARQADNAPTGSSSRNIRLLPRRVGGFVLTLAIRAR